MIIDKCNIPFPFVYNYDRLFIVGTSGSGKTYLTQKICKCLQKDGYQYAVLTHGNEYNRKYTYDIGYDVQKAIENFTIYGVEHAPITLIFEDIPTLFYSPAIPKVFQMLLVRGRHMGIGFIFISQTTRRIPTLILANSNKYVLFKILDDRQLSLLNIPNLKEKLLNLKKYEFFYYDKDTGKEFKAKT